MHGGGVPGMHWDPIGPPGTPVSPSPLPWHRDMWCRSLQVVVPGSHPHAGLENSCCMSKRYHVCACVLHNALP